MPTHCAISVTPRSAVRRGSYLRRTALGLCLILAAGCAGRGAPTPVVPPAPEGCPLCVDPTSPKVLAAYVAALAEARVPTPRKVSRELQALIRSNDDLITNRRGRILMVTWTKARYYQDVERFSRGKSFALHGDTWFSVAPVEQRFCQALGLTGEMLVLRLEQRIGLPPGDGKDAFLQLWVDPADLFRPCPDPEISDHECLVEIPVAGGGGESRPPDDPPWSCDPEARQVSGKFVTVEASHLEWMCANWRSSYGHRDPLDNYPWTALGYTYDWGNPDNPRGASEFVALGGTEVTFHSLTPTELYCTP